MVCRLTPVSMATLHMKFVAAVVLNSEMTTNLARPSLPPSESIEKNGLPVDASGLIQRRKRKIGAWLISSRLPAYPRMKKEPNQSLEPTTTAVTICAGAQLAPAAVVAHL